MTAATIAATATSAATVAAVVPTWNRADRVEAAVESILAQTRPPDELVVVDDGSTDGTAARLRSRFPAIRVLETARRGPAAARNRGVAATRSEWIAFLDSDDLWLPEKLAAQLAALAAAPAARVCHTDELWIRNGRRVNPRGRHRKPSGRVFRDCLPLCCLSPSAIVLHREVFAAVGGFDEAYPACEDYELWLRIAARYEVLLVDRPLVVKHGGHPDQLSRTVPVLDRFRIRALDAILRREDLGAGDRAAAVAALAQKIGVVAAGARRRGREAEAAELERLRDAHLAGVAPAAARGAA